jgi:SAM-dependent methyltransferase
VKEEEIRPQELFNRYLELSRQDVERCFSDRSRFEHAPCPACGADDPRPGVEKHGFVYVHCGHCGSLYTSPRPSADDIDDFYRTGEAVRFWASDFFRVTAEARRERMFRPRARLAADLAAERLGDGVASAVDVGSGYGIFLEELAATGRFDPVVGIEPSPDLAAVCREKGFEIVESTIEAVEPGRVQAEIATVFEVIEHVHEPVEFLRSCARALRPGGLLLFTTLTVSGFDIKVLGVHSKSIHPPHHLNLMTTEGIEALVDRAGLELVDLSTPGELDVDIVANMLAEDPSIEVPPFVSYLLERRDETTRAAFQRFLQEHRLSSHVRVVAQAR